MKCKMWCFGVATVLAASLLFFAAVPANADIITLSVANANLATQGSGPYGQLDITQTGNNSFQVVASGLNNFVFGGTSVVGLSLSASAGTATFGSASNCLLAGGGATCTFSAGGSGNVDGFGTFNFIVNDGNGFSNGGYVHFTFTFTTANDILLDDLLVANGQGASAVGHMALATNTACTGYAGDAGRSTQTTPDDSHCGTSTPEPGSMTLLGIGLVGGAIGIIRRKLFR